jgi:hypothetical protein
MDALSELLHFVEFLFLFALALIVLFVVLLVVISKMPHDNPLKRILTALSYRVGATGAVMLVDAPASIAPVGKLFDLVTFAVLIYYWYTFFKTQRPAMQAAWNASPPPPPSQTPPTPPLPRRPSPPEIERRRK